MVTTVLPGLAKLILFGNKLEFIVRSMFSSFSRVLSFTMAILNVTLVSPAGIPTLYGPET